MPWGIQCNIKGLEILNAHMQQLNEAERIWSDIPNRRLRLLAPL